MNSVGTIGSPSGEAVGSFGKLEAGMLTPAGGIGAGASLSAGWPGSSSPLRTKLHYERAGALEQARVLVGAAQNLGGRNAHAARRRAARLAPPMDALPADALATGCISPAEFSRSTTLYTMEEVGAPEPVTSSVPTP